MKTFIIKIALCIFINSSTIKTESSELVLAAQNLRDARALCREPQNSSYQKDEARNLFFKSLLEYNSQMTNENENDHKKYDLALEEYDKKKNDETRKKLRKVTMEMYKMTEEGVKAHAIAYKTSANAEKYNQMKPNELSEHIATLNKEFEDALDAIHDYNRQAKHSNLSKQNENEDDAIFANFKAMDLLTEIHDAKKVLQAKQSFFGYFFKQ